MTSVVLTTELEAVNTMLSAINEAPVSSLGVTGLADLTMAINVISEVSRLVQERGWHFNTEADYPLPRDVSNFIQVAANVLAVDTDGGYASYDVVIRNTKLYWKDKHTFVFDKDLKGALTFLLPWDELPQAARHYIMIRAARLFQARMLGSDTKHRFSEKDEVDALTSLVAADANTADYNMLTGSWSVANILAR